jgi:hypothetical protein
MSPDIRLIDSLHGFGIALDDATVYDLTVNPPRPLPTHRANGYPSISVQPAGKKLSRYVHLLLLEAWGPPRPTPAHRARFIDRDKNNVTLANLEWKTLAELRALDVERSRRRGERSWGSKLTNEQVTRIRDMIAAGHTLARIADTFDMRPTAISNIKTGRTWKHLPDHTAKEAA